MNLFLSKNIELDDKETVVMAILNGLYSNKNENLYISTSLLGYAITGRFLNVKNNKDINEKNKDEDEESVSVL